MHKPSWRIVALCVTVGAALAASAAGAMAHGHETVARTGMQVFAQHCFSPFMTAEHAKSAFSIAGLQYDFYDLDPFSSVAPSPVQGRAATPGTDRRCEVSFAGHHGDAAAKIAVQALKDENILKSANVPPKFQPAEGTSLLAARQLNPRRVAVVHVGTRAMGDSIETFMLVERLLPSDQPD